MRTEGEGVLLPLTEEQELSYPSDQLRLRATTPRSARLEVVYNLRVRDIMTRAVVTIRRNDPLHEVTRRMRAFHVSGLPVVDAKGHVVGIVTETDVARVLGEKTGASPLGILLHETPLPRDLEDESLLNRYRSTLARVKVRYAMTPDPVTIGPRETVEAAVRLMQSERVNRLPVVEKRRLVGIVARQDVLTALLPT